VSHAQFRSHHAIYILRDRTATLLRLYRFFYSKWITCVTYYFLRRAPDGADGRDTSLPPGRSRVRCLMERHYPSGCTMAMGSSKALNRWETQTFRGARKVELRRPVRTADLTTSCTDCHETMEPQPPGTLSVCTGIALPLPGWW